MKWREREGRVPEEVETALQEGSSWALRVGSAKVRSLESRHGGGSEVGPRCEQTCILGRGFSIWDSSVQDSQAGHASEQ